MSPAPDLRLNPQDQVAIACRDLEPRMPLENTACQDLIPAGHKVALAAIASGESVRRYGQVIGIASRAIAPGQHVHAHNLAMAEHDRDYHFGDDYVPTQPDTAGVTFSVIVCPDGRVGTRNYLGVLSSVNCSAGSRQDHHQGRSVQPGKSEDGSGSGPLALPPVTRVWSD
jgi:altronate hydrolase